MATIAQQLATDAAALFSNFQSGGLTASLVWSGNTITVIPSRVNQNRKLEPGGSYSDWTGKVIAKRSDFPGDVFPQNGQAATLDGVAFRIDRSITAKGAGIVTIYLDQPGRAVE
jgi:hypothetical protein